MTNEEDRQAMAMSIDTMRLNHHIKRTESFIEEYPLSYVGHPAIDELIHQTELARGQSHE